MLLLAIDTSGKNGSLALARAQDDNVQILELVPLAGRMYSAQVIPSLQEALTRQKLNKTDLNGFVVATGPGSFTGLRVGISTVKALSEVLHKPLAAVSVLEAAARVTGVGGRVIVALDAGRKQVFVGDYDLTSGAREESLLSWEYFFQSAADWDARLFSPDEAVREAAMHHAVVIEPMEAPKADTYARIGYEKLKTGDMASAELLEANYIRASDAELFSLPKLIR